MKNIQMKAEKDRIFCNATDLSGHLRKDFLEEK